MVRIIVTTERGDPFLLDDPVLLNEHVGSEHLSDGHSAAQLVERLRWAVTDAEDAERELSNGNGNGNGHTNGNGNGHAAANA
jgi:hypothetical protein